VLKSTHDVATDGESSSSMASDKAPSEDNLEPEEIQMVLPEVEDENSPFKKKKTIKRDVPSGAGMMSA